MRKVIKDFRLKNFLIIIGLIFLVLPIITNNTFAFFLPGPGGDPPGGGDLGDPGTITITSPIAYTEFYYLDKINVIYEIVTNTGFGFIKSNVLVNGDSRGTFYGKQVNEYIYPNSYVGYRDIVIEGQFFKDGEVITKTSDPVTIELYSAIDKDDISDLRIDKVQRMGYGGQSITICIIDTNLGFNDYYNGPNDLGLYHPSIYKERSDSYKEIVYYDVDWPSYNYWNGFGKTNSEKKSIWEDIAEYNSRNNNDYGSLLEVHGTCSMSILTQVAPHARYVYISCEKVFEDDQGQEYEDLDLTPALQWLVNGFRYRDLGIDIISISMGGPLDVTDKNLLTFMTDDPNYPVIPLASSGNFNENFVEYPAYHSNIIGVGGVQDSDSYSFTDPFTMKNDDENSNFEYIWDFAHTDLFEITTSKSRPNSFESSSLKAIASKGNDNAKSYDGVQFWDDMIDGSIEAWFYGEASQYQVGALWLRTGTINTDNNPSFTYGYLARIYNQYFALLIFDGSKFHKLNETPLGVDWNNQWWNMKFEINGTTLNAWIENEVGTIKRSLTATDNQFTSGKPGFSARTNLASPRNLYIDELTIKTYDDTRNTFVGDTLVKKDGPMNWHRYISWMPKDLPFNGYQQFGSSYGNGLDIYAIFDGTDMGWNPFYPQETSENFEFTGTSNACPLAAGIVAISLQYWYKYHSSVLDVYDFISTDWSILKYTGDIIGESPITNGEDPESFYGAYTTKSFEFGFGIIDAYEIYLYMRYYM